MIVSAYEYAEGGGEVPRYLQMSFNVETYGVDALFGRPLTAGELYRMNAARRVYESKKAQKAHANRAEWAQNNQAMNDLLIHVEKIISESDNNE